MMRRTGRTGAGAWWTFRLLLALVFAAVGASQATGVRANGAPIKVVLSYLVEVSNFGNTSATGIAEIVMREGEIKVAATGLQPLDRQVYHIWLVNTSTGDAFDGGPVRPNQGGQVNAINVLPGEIPDKRYSLAVLTVEEPSGVGQRPSDLRSIAGYVQSAPPPGEGQLPRDLPNTGGDLPVEPARMSGDPVTEQSVGLSRATVLGLGGLAVGLGAVWLGRLAGRSRRSKG